ncbi:MAG: SDR family oxidoreductase [Phocaeicola vulgatus]|nr:MAG: SDR family oxidoreductase [Phocaeicola vulgatus]
MSKRLDRFNITLLARPSKINKEKLATYEAMEGIRIVWGDLTSYQDVLNGVTGADYVLHVGGMVSPAADYFPKKTLKVNTTAAQHIVDAVKSATERRSDQGSLYRLRGAKPATVTHRFIGDVREIRSI